MLFFYFVLVIIFLWIIWWLFGYSQCKLREKRLFENKEVIDEKALTLFSNRELSRKIIKNIKARGKSLNIQCGSQYALEISKDVSKEVILEKIELLQQLMISKRYSGDKEENLENDIDAKMLDIWIDYGDNAKYRKKFERVILDELERGKISKEVFYEMYNRFYLFEFKE